MYLEKIIFDNRAPFEHLEIDFKDIGVNVLTAINGKGKTTILSHITDAFYELAKPVFHQEFAGKENELYRISFALYNTDSSKPSIVYFRFKDGEENYDYVDICGDCKRDQYDRVINIDKKIDYSHVDSDLKQQNFSKHWSLCDRKKIEKLFKKNVLTFFPSYRFELPAYLNGVYSKSIGCIIKNKFSGYLPNPIEIITDISSFSNWLLDVILDMKLNEQLRFFRDNNNNLIPINTPSKENTIFNNLNKILSSTLSSKKYNGIVRFGIGKRNNGMARIAIMNDVDKQHYQICPSLFQLSSGELALLLNFGEILHQADNNQNNILLEQIRGIVLIDEVDKHLHITLQKEILPKMFAMFPNVQFIVSSHSPFFNMGLAEQLSEKHKIFDLDHNGISCSATQNEQYEEVYKMMIGENKLYFKLYNELNTKISSTTKPLVITEGKTDAVHLKAAMKKLNIAIDVEFYNIDEDWGDSKLKTLLENLSKIKQNRKIIGIFDRDDEKDTYIKFTTTDSNQYKQIGIIDSNVYGFCIPSLETDTYNNGNRISIEHYYNKSDLLKENSEHRRIFLGEEFFANGNSKNGQYQTKISQIQNKVKINGIIDDKVFKRDDLEQNNNIALTKNDFANLVLYDAKYAVNFDFSNFRKIFSIIEEIIS